MIIRLLLDDFQLGKARRPFSILYGGEESVDSTAELLKIVSVYNVPTRERHERRIVASFHHTFDLCRFCDGAVLS